MGRLTALEAKLKSGESMSPTEQAKLVEIARYYRKLLAMKTAESDYLEGKNFEGIDANIRPLGFRLVKIMNSRIPVLEEISSG